MIPTSNELSTLVLTLAYTDQFDFPLTTAEIWQRQLGINLSLVDVTDGLKHLEELDLIKKQANYWHLTTGKASSTIREKRARRAANMLLEAQVMHAWLVKIPWIKAVGITGSLAMKNPNKDADTDFMIITQAGRLWITRFLVTIVSWWLGKRRGRNSSGEGSWCFNLWLDERSLRLSPSRRQLYAAHELCQVDWVFERDRTIERFYQQNFWVAKFLPVFYQQKLEEIKNRVLKLSSVAENIIVRGFLNLIEKLMFWSQYTYMYPHQGREEVAPDRAFFHPRDTKHIIIKGWVVTILNL